MAVQPQNMTRGLKFWILEEEDLCYLCSKNKRADQLPSYCTSDLHLCFRMCKMRFSHSATHVFLTGIPPPGDLIALGSRPDSADKKMGLGKRESTSLLTPAAAMKKPKLVSQTQTFTPLGRPAERDTERSRVSPVPTVSNLFEQSAIDGMIRI